MKKTQKPKWYRKRTDPEAIYIATQCGIDLYHCIGDFIHEDDIGDIRRMLGLRKDTFNELFPEHSGEFESEADSRRN